MSAHAPLASNDGKPVPVEVVNPSLGTHITNPHALVHGIFQGQANNLEPAADGRLRAGHPHRSGRGLLAAAAAAMNTNMPDGYYWFAV